MRLIIDAEDVKELTSIQNLVIDKTFEWSINSTFFKYFREILGATFEQLYDKLSTNDHFTNLERSIIDRFKSSLAHYVVAENITNISIRYTRAGIVSVQNSEYQNLSIEDLKYLKGEWLQKANDLRSEFIVWFNKTILNNQNEISEMETKNFAGFIFPIRNRNYSNWSDWENYFNIKRN